MESVTSDQLGVSVVVAARNEASRLPRLLHSLACQHYPKWEVIVVDDYSTDATIATARRAGKNLPAFQIIRNAYAPGKKGALRTGVEHATHPVILFTDADCQPCSVYWIDAMTQPLRRNATVEIVVGGSYILGNGLRACFQQYDHFWEIQQGIWFSQLGRPYLATGRNWACRKNTWLRLRHIPKFWHTPWGDDDQAILALATPNNYRWNLSTQTMVATTPPSSLTHWLYQRQRHLRGGARYPWKLWIGLALINLIFTGGWWSFLMTPHWGHLIFLIAWTGMAFRTRRKAYEYGFFRSLPVLAKWLAIQILYHALLFPVFYLALPFQRRQRLW